MGVTATQRQSLQKGGGHRRTQSKSQYAPITQQIIAANQQSDEAEN